MELCNLKLKDLDGLEGLDGLRKLNLSGLQQLVNLNPVSSLTQLEELDIYGLTKLEALPCLGSLSKLKTIGIRNCESLLDISALAAAKSLLQVSINGSHQLNAGPVVWPDGLISLSLEQTSLRELGACPAGLKEINISNNRKLVTINGIGSCVQLKISSWGLDLSGCFSLEGLDGLNIPSLEAISIPETIANLDALSKYPDIKIAIIAAQGHENNNNIVPEIPDALGHALNTLKIKALNVRTEWGFDLQGVSGLAAVADLKALDLSECNLLDITGIAALHNLKFLSIKPRSELSKRLGKATFDTKGQLDRLRLKLLAGL